MAGRSSRIMTHGCSDHLFRRAQLRQRLGGDILSIYGSNFIPAAAGRLLCTWAGSGAPPTAATFDSHLAALKDRRRHASDVTVGVATISDVADRSLPEDGSDRSRTMTRDLRQNHRGLARGV